MKNVTIYSTPSCGACNTAKDFFKENNVEYIEKDVASDAEARQEMLNKSQQMGVPVTDIDGNIVVGFDKQKFSQLLDI